MRAVFHSEARLELAEAARWYNSQSRGLGSNLRREVKAAVRASRQIPSGSAYWKMMFDVDRSIAFPMGFSTRSGRIAS